MDLFNIWDLERVNIKPNKKLIKKLNKNIFSQFKTKPKAHIEIFPDKKVPFSTFKNLLKESYIKHFFVPLDVYLEIIDRLNISREYFQENIIAYKTAGGTNYVECPTLPIKITPVFDMLFAHHVGDGTVINPKKGRLPYFGYRQFDKFYRVAFVKKLENIFGKINFFKEGYFENSTRLYCPPVLSSLFFKYYNVKIEDFLSWKARIPQIIFDKGDESILAVLIAFIIDGGSIDSTQITISLKNKLLVQDLGEISNNLGYKFKITQAKSEQVKGYWRLHILRESMKKLWEDYLELNKNYPIIDLGIKGEKIKKSLEIYSKKIYKTGGNKEIILGILRNEQLSINQLAYMINMTRQGVRFYIHNLIKEGKIRLIENKGLNWVYGI
ncbi:hypothetical protein COV15_00165 [Candidatus Woesearchaeota archaeon CG10_big_fil_rev_8_21_14_0_10_34_12]|nr:MAG: hypothetical protein COV15_00165 [Candidatus Woesearchaeota archaeon CG10_big_fil_rev_8_21_14_0_10_34_12]